MPHATALTVLTDNQLPMVHQNCLKFFGEVASYDRYHGLVHDGDEASRIVDAFGSARCLMMANHGVIVTGETAAEAFDSLYYLEQAAKLVTIAMSTGRPLRPIDPAVCAATAEAMRDERPLYARRHFDALRRTMLRGQDYGQSEGEDLDALAKEFCDARAARRLPAQPCVGKEERKKLKLAKPAHRRRTDLGFLPT